LAAVARIVMTVRVRSCHSPIGASPDIRGAIVIWGIKAGELCSH